PRSSRRLPGAVRPLARTLSSDGAWPAPSVRIAPRQPMDSQLGRPPGTEGHPGRAMMAAAPSVSVLMTAYNREAFIAEAIDSVLAQTFSDFELIVSDDGSHDGTVRIAGEYARRDPRVRGSMNATTLGDYPNRRHAASLARGAYLKYHDSDDVMYPHCLETMVRALEKEPSAAFALSGSQHWPGGPCPMLLTPRLAYEREFLGA